MIGKGIHIKTQLYQRRKSIDRFSHITAKTGNENLIDQRSVNHIPWSV